VTIFGDAKWVISGLGDFAMTVGLLQKRYLLARLHPKFGRGATARNLGAGLCEPAVLAGHAYFATTCNKGQLSELIAENPDLICLDADDFLEPVAPISPRLATVARSGNQPSSAPLLGREKVVVQVLDDARMPIALAEVSFENGQVLGADSAMTDAQGRATLTIRRSAIAANNTLFVEKAGYWGKRMDAPNLMPAVLDFVRSNTVTLTKVANAGSDNACWGLEAMRLSQAPEGSVLGVKPVRVAILHALPAPYGAPGPIAEFPAAEQDVDLVQGWAPLAHDASPSTVGVQNAASEFTALHAIIGAAAPAATVVSLCLPARPQVSEVIKALAWCGAHEIDIVLVALCLKRDNRALHSAVQAARQAGMMLIAPVGDLAGHVAYPAAYPEVIGVAAISQDGSIPDTAPHARFHGACGRDKWRMATFSGQGDEVTLCAPGASVTPGGEGVVRSGTCLAAAYIAGFAARLLQSTPSLAPTQHDAARVRALTAGLLSACCDLGLPAPLQGRGMPIWGYRGQIIYRPEMENALSLQAQQVMDGIATGTL
jgi:hypothetical protein